MALPASTAAAEYATEVSKTDELPVATPVRSTHPQARP